MLDPSELFELDPDRPEMGRPVLIQALDGFIDAGGAKRLAREHLLETYDSHVVATFDVDQLLDYRARRPTMLFVEDHWESYDDPQLAVHLVSDAVGTPFLLLAGPEPDVQWERFTAAVKMVIDRLGVRLTIGLNAIPMGVPHTRPTGVIAHGSRKELVAGYEPWVNAVQVPGTAGHLLEYRLGEAGYDAVGFAVHVPHYVAQTEYPGAAAALLAEVSKASGLALPLDSLLEAASTTRAALDEQVAGAPEVAAVVQALESQYDAFIAGRDSTLLLENADLPTADELGAELERFLAEQSQDPPQ
ncbi:MAG: PAC2 family protein [Frankiaceae bacterium]|nr:PAC2 family protein [Frankiaceae bacterium]